LGIFLAVFEVGKQWFESQGLIHTTVEGKLGFVFLLSKICSAVITTSNYLVNFAKTSPSKQVGVIEKICC
jgi:hypothetical protein